MYDVYSIEDQAYCGRMFWLHARSLLPLLLSLLVCRRSSLLTGEGGRACSQIIRPQESLGLYKSFNPLWTGLTKIGDFVFSAVAFERLPECSWHLPKQILFKTIFYFIPRIKSRRKADKKFCRSSFLESLALRGIGA